MKIGRTVGVAMAIAVLFATACSKEEKPNRLARSLKPGDSAVSVMETARTKLKKKEYEEALDYFELVKTSFPRDPLSAEAHLEQGETYFAWKQFTEAANAFADFRKLHPQHPRADYALFRQGEAWIKQAPRTIDRDLNACRQAVVVFDEFFRRYPRSEYVDKAHEMSAMCQEKLAGQEFYIGRFYFRRGKHKAAAKRLERVLREHSGFGYDEKAAWYLGRAYDKMGAYEDADRVWNELLEHYPNGRYTERVEKKQKKRASQGKKAAVGETSEKVETSETGESPAR